MSRRLLSALFAAAWCCLPVHAADESGSDAAALFGARPDAHGMRLSPDGRHVAYIAPRSGQGTALMVLALSAGAVPTVALVGNGDPERISGCDWVANDRLVCKVFWIHPFPGKGPLADLVGISYWHLVAVNSDGSEPRTLSAPDSNGMLDFGLSSGSIIDLLAGEDGQLLISRTYDHIGGVERNGMGVDRVDTRTGTFSTVIPPVPHTYNYLTDGNGVVRIMEQRKITFRHLEDSVITYYFRDANGDEWRKLSTYDRKDSSGFVPIAVDGRLNIAYGLKDQNGHRALFTRKLDGSNVDELVFASDAVDVIGTYSIGRHPRIIGTDFVADYSEVQYSDPDIKRLIESLRPTVGSKSVLRILDSNSDESKYLLLSTADQSPGIYSIYDNTTHHLDKVMPVRVALAGITLAQVTPVKFPAKDGTLIPGYLTLPPGAASAKGLPAIVMPHGGPDSRDIWGFNWMVQYFAHQGYAVLQPNFRGSDGYGGSWFAHQGYRSWQVAIGDVLDAGRWLVDQGIADPNKLGIFGWSYGGYAALQSVVIEQGLFKAAVAVAPVTDLPAYLDEYRVSTTFALTRDFVGTGAHARAGSPAEHADRIKAPVLLFHGSLDLTVNYDQSKRMDRALTAAGVKHKFVTFEGLDHEIEDADKRAELLRESDAFFKAAGF